MGQGLVEQLQRAERQAIADLFFAANSLAGVSAGIDDRAAHSPNDITSGAVDLRTRASQAHANLIRLTAAHSPVAGDLRLVLALIELAHNCTLIANQFDLIRDQLTELDPSTHDRAQNAEKLTKMAAIASVQLRKATDTFRFRDLEAARQLDRDDDKLDALNREVCDTVATLESDRDERDVGFRHVLIARSLERIGDNAVDIGEQTAFLITARRAEFSDASQPRRRATT